MTELEPIREDIEEPSKKDSSQTRFDRIYQEIRERICLIHYPPGKVLSEQQLAAEFGVSRTPIRRVLLRLSFDGLVDIKNGVGTIVTDIDLKTFKEVSELRIALTDLMGTLSPAPILDAQIGRAERLVERAKALRGRRDFQEYARVSNELAEILLSMIGNAPLRDITEILHYRVARIWFTLLPGLDWPRTADALVEEIEQTLAAMRRGDASGVARVRHHFLHRMLTWISEYITGRQPPG